MNSPILDQVMSHINQTSKSVLKEERDRAKDLEQISEILEKATKIDGFNEWKKKLEETIKVKKRREEAFDIVLILIDKFESITFRQFAWLLGMPKSKAGRALKHLKESGKVIVLTEQTQGHPYRILRKK
jgi:Fic family protein